MPSHRLHGITTTVFSHQVLAAIVVSGPILHRPKVLCAALIEAAWFALPEDRVDRWQSWHR
jgi:hypothetical protein